MPKTNVDIKNQRRNTGWYNVQYHGQKMNCRPGNKLYEISQVKKGFSDETQTILLIIF